MPLEKDHFSETRFRDEQDGHCRQTPRLLQRQGKPKAHDRTERVRSGIPEHGALLQIGAGACEQGPEQPARRRGPRTVAQEHQGK